MDIYTIILIYIILILYMVYIEKTPLEKTRYNDINEHIDLLRYSSTIVINLNCVGMR